MASLDTESATRKGQLFFSNIDKEDSVIYRDDVNKNNSSAPRLFTNGGRRIYNHGKGGDITTSMMTYIAYLIYMLM